MLPAGWIAVPRDGSAVIGDLGVTLGARESVLERRAEANAWPARRPRSSARSRTCGGCRPGRRRRAGRDRPAAETARAEESRAGAERRAAEEAERAGRERLETVVRETSWHDAQAGRLAAELARARAAVAAPGPDAGRRPARARRRRAGGAARRSARGRLGVARGRAAPPARPAGRDAGPPRRLDARRNRGGRGPRRRPRWPRSGWPAPIATSRHWPSASGRWPRRADALRTEMATTTANEAAARDGLEEVRRR